MKNHILGLYYYFKRLIISRPSYKRVFVAIDVPYRSHQMTILREIGQQVQDSLKQADITCIQEPNLHETLVFIGEINESRIPVVKRALKKAKTLYTQESEARIHLRYAPILELFGSAIVLLIEPDNELNRLHAQIETTLRNYGIVLKDAQKFIAHTTLSRIKVENKINEAMVVGILNSLSHRLAQNKKERAISLQVTSFKLYQSIGGKYKELAKYTI